MTLFFLLLNAGLAVLNGTFYVIYGEAISFIAMFLSSMAAGWFFVAWRDERNA